MDDSEDRRRRGLSRREFIERTGATLGLITVGAACGGDDATDEGADAVASGNGGTGAGAASGGGGEPSAGSSTGGTSAGTTGAGAGADTGGAGPATGGAGVGSGGGGGETGGTGGMAGSEPGMDGGMGGTGGTNPAPSGATVAFVKNADVDVAVARAVELAGGIDEIQAGQTVFIKPNCVSDRMVGAAAIRTSNEVIAAVVRLVKQRNPGRIIVGDRSARSFNTDQVFVNAGITEAAMAAGADEVYPAPSPTTSPDAWMLVQPPHYDEVWSGPGGILVMRKIVEADHLINVPTCKNHRFALFSLSLKNFVGGIGDSSRDPLHYASSTLNDFEPLGRDIALLTQAFKPLVSIIDATTSLINGGPGGDQADAVRVQTGMIIAARDRVALDTAALSLMRHELGRNTVSSPDPSNSHLRQDPIWQLPQIANAIELGIGIPDASEGALVFDGVPDEDAMAIEEIWRS